jgi:predicted NBD/HSP70 family sugar kinase
VFDPEVLILGGDVMASAPGNLSWLHELLQKHAHTSLGKPRMVAFEVGDDTALVAGVWPWEDKWPSRKIKSGSQSP